jgi:hypothetical protein
MAECLRFLAHGGADPQAAPGVFLCKQCEEALACERLAPIAFYLFKGFAPTDLMARAYKVALGAQMVYQQFFLEITQACAARGVPVLPLKGLYLAEKIYPAPGARPMSDLDLLVPQEQFHDAAQILRALGFSCDLDFMRGSELPSGVTFQHAGRHVNVDLHFSLLNGQGIRGLLLQPGQVRILDTRAFETSVREPYLDQTISALSRPYFLLSLLLHHYTHNFTGLMWFLDAIYTSRAMEQAGWEEFERIIKDNGLETAAGLWLRLAAVNFHCPESTFLPESMQTLCRAAERAHPLFADAVRRGRLTPRSALALVPTRARRARAVARALFPSRAYLQGVSHKPIRGPYYYLKELFLFQKRLLLR